MKSRLSRLKQRYLEFVGGVSLALQIRLADDFLERVDEREGGLELRVGQHPE